MFRFFRRNQHLLHGVDGDPRLELQKAVFGMVVSKPEQRGSVVDRVSSSI